MNDPRHAAPSSGSTTPRMGSAPAPEELVDLEPLELLDDEAAAAPAGASFAPTAPAAPAPKKITFGPEIQHRQENWTRKTTASGSGSGRVRSFHGKLSEQGLEYMDFSINQWLDQHPEIEVKFVTSSIGQFDGKMKEPAVILQVWY